MTPGYYDRVYCGANVPPMESLFMKSLIKVLSVLCLLVIHNTSKTNLDNYSGCF